MNKKGEMEDLWFVVMEAVILGLTAFALFAYARNVADSTLYWKNFYARDVALVVDTMHAAPGEVNMNYDFLNIPRLLELELSKDKVKVYEYEPGVDKSKLSPGTFYFAQDKYIQVEPSSFFSYYFVLEKANFPKGSEFSSKISVRQQEEAVSSEIIKESCPEAITQAVLKEKKIYIKAENTKLSSLEAAVKDLFKKRVYAETEEEQYNNNILNLREADAELIVILSFSQDSKLNVYYNENDVNSEKLACILLLNLQNTDYFQGKSPSKKSSTQLSADLQRFFAQKDAVVIELGSETDNVPLADTATAIFSSIRSYYE
jgi:hypothetical protein